LIDLPVQSPSWKLRYSARQDSPPLVPILNHRNPLHTLTPQELFNDVFRFTAEVSQLVSQTSCTNFTYELLTSLQHISWPA